MTKIAKTILSASMVAAGLAAGGTLPAYAAEQSLKIQPDQRYQTMEGFGTCLISWVPAMERLYQTPQFQKVYAEDLGFNILRTSIWGPTLDQQARNPDDISYRNASFEGRGNRTKVFIDFARAIKRINPDVKVIGTVWSPPAWMKENNSITDDDGSGAMQGTDNYRNGRGRVFDNRVKKEYYPHFVAWMVEMVKLYDEAGVPFYAVSPGNEVQFTQGFESCVWNAEDFATITAMLGEELEKEGYGDVLIFGPETMTGHNHSTANPAYIEALRSNRQAWEHLDVFATHGYEDGFVADMSQNSSAAYWNLIKDSGKPYWTTEGGTGGHDWPEPLNDNGVAMAMHNAIVAGHASAFVPWQVVEREKNTHGLMTTDGMTGKTHVVRHYSNFIKPGAVRIEAAPAYGNVTSSAYLHEEEGTLTVVVTNPTGEEQTINLATPEGLGIEQFDVYRTTADEHVAKVEPAVVSGGSASVTLPARSLVTLVGKTVGQSGGQASAQ